MSEPVIPERMDCGVPDGTIFECQKPGLLVRLKQAEDENWVYRQSVIWPPDYERLQAKVAELEADASDATDFGQAESERYEAALDVLEAKVAEHEATHTAMLDNLRARLKESEELSWKNWRGREEAYAEMRVCRTERDDAVNMIRKQAATIAEEESRSNELAKEVAILRVNLKGQEATIARLTGPLQLFLKYAPLSGDMALMIRASQPGGDEAHNRANKLIEHFEHLNEAHDKGQAALSKQEPAAAKEGE